MFIISTLTLSSYVFSVTNILGLKAFFFQFFLVENRFFRIFHVQIPVSEGILEHDHAVFKEQRHIGGLILQRVGILKMCIRDRSLPGNSYFYFTIPAPKLPSIFAFPDRLPAYDQSSLKVQKMYSSSSQPFLYSMEQVSLSAACSISRSFDFSGRSYII